MSIQKTLSIIKPDAMKSKYSGKIIDLIESNEEKDPRLNIAKTDIIFLFSLLSTNKSMVNFDINYENKELVIH